MERVIDEILQEGQEVTGVSDDVRQRLSRIIEREGDRIRRDADHESAAIIAKAK